VKNHPDSIEWDNIGVRSFSTHAEMDVIISYLHSKKIYGVRKHSPLYVKKMIDAKRLKMPKTLTVVSPYKGRFRNSRPCNECIKVMRLYGIKNVVYSTGNPEQPFCKEIVSEMKMMGSSSGNTRK